ncbi:MAG: hypothetical protein ACRYGC_05745 [Janthinobacterium lividum]
MSAAARTRWTAHAIRLAWLLPGLLALLVSYALLRFLLLPVLPGLGPEVAASRAQGPALWPAALNSLRLATLAAAGAVLPAVWLGLMLERRAWRGRGVLALALWLLFLLPGYLAAAGWQIVLGLPALRAAPWLRDALLGWPGLAGLSVLRGLPVATLAARAGWSQCPARIEDAMRVHVRGRLRRALPAVAPMLPFAAAAFLIVFVETVQEYGLATTLGARLRLPLLSTEIYASLANWPISWVRAARAGDLLVLVALLPALLRPLLPRAVPTRAGPRAVATHPASRAGQAGGWAAAVVLLALGGAVPLLALAAGLASPEAAALPDGAAHALLASALYGFVASLLALCLACALVARPPSSRLAAVLGWLPMVNMAVPGIVLGAAVVIAFNAPPLPLTGTPLALLLAETATQLPVLALLLGGSLRAGGGVAGEAARVHGLALAVRIERIHLPPLVRPLAWAWSLAFCRLFFELPLSQMLAPAGGEPVGVVLVQLQQSLRLAAEARLAVLALLLCGAVVAAVLFLARARR